MSTSTARLRSLCSVFLLSSEVKVCDSDMILPLTSVPSSFIYLFLFFLSLGITITTLQLPLSSFLPLLSCFLLSVSLSSFSLSLLHFLHLHVFSLLTGRLFTVTYPLHPAFTHPGKSRSLLVN